VIDTIVPVATERQAEFIKSLLASRTGYTDEFAERVSTALAEDSLPRKKASEVIDYLLKHPNAAKAATVTTEVEQGYYAVKSLSGNQDLDFFKVDKPESGKWAGYTFVKRVIGGRADVRVRGAEARKALDAIAADADAGPRYGREIGNCWVCGRHLTDEESRATGIGPVCAGRR
jgi:hypothetical protein